MSLLRGLAWVDLAVGGLLLCFAAVPALTVVSCFLIAIALLLLDIGNVLRERL